MEKQTSTEGFFRPFANRRVTNMEMFFDLLQELMAGVVLMHAALDAFASEEIPEDFVYVDERGREQNRDELLGRGIELRLSRVLAASTGLDNIRTAKPDTWQRLEELKTLPDAVAHGLRPLFVLAQAAADNIYSRLAAADVAGMLAAVEETMEHYIPQQPPEGFRHNCVLTNTAGAEIGSLELRHRDHARVENRVRNWKARGLGNLPFDDVVTWPWAPDLVRAFGRIRSAFG